MSAFAGPEIVNDGLVLCLDAGNTKSYPGSGTTWFDLSPTKLNFTVNASYITSQGLSSEASATSATTSILNTDNHTIFFMYKIIPTVTYPNGHSGSWSKIFSHNAGGSDRSPSVWRYPSNRFLHWRYDPSNTGGDFNFSELNLDTWHFIGTTKSGSTASQFVNGKKLGQATVSNPKTSGNAPVILWEGYTASAILNFVHIYNRELSEQEVLQNFNALRGRFGI